MSKKIILFLVCFNFIVFGCSYEPVLLQKKIDFTVGQFISSGEKNINLKKFVEIYNKRYDIINLREINRFNLKSFTLRSYHFKNMLAFGDLLHKTHPLAGQGFNMSIRDIKEVVELRLKMQVFILCY